MTYRVTPFDWFLLVALVVCWGSSFVMSKIALQHVAPEWIAAARLCFAGVFLLVVATLRGQPIPRDAASMKAYVWLGLVGNAVPFALITWGMQHITSGVAGLLMGTIPLIVIAMAHFALPGERLTLPRMGGFIMGFIGIVVLMGPENLINIKAHGQELLGQCAVLVGCLLYGINAISTKRMKLPGTIAVTAGVLLVGAIMATAFAWVQSPFQLQSAPPSTLLAIAGLGLFPTAIATVLWFKAVERTSPTFTSMSNYLVPVYALCFGAMLLGESIGLNVVFALLLILAGIFISRITMQPLK